MIFSASINSVIDGKLIKPINRSRFFYLIFDPLVTVELGEIINISQSFEIHEA